MNRSKISLFSAFCVCVHSCFRAFAKSVTERSRSSRLCALLPLLRRGLGGGVLFCSITASAQFSGGTGTSSDPYIITTAAELAQMATYVNSGDIVYNAAHYKLANNIDLAEYGEEWNGGRGWIPIGTILSGDPTNPFKGVFNGDGNVISGLYINTTSNYAGLFGCVVNGTIENLGLENVNITANWVVGGIVSFLAGSVIDKCYITGSVVGQFSGFTEVGGIAGSVNAGITSYVGSSSVTNCYSTASVSGIDMVGGITGRVSNSCNISNCYSTGAISGKNYIGGISGNVANNGSTATDCAALNPSVKATGSPFGRITGQVADASLYNNVAFEEMLNNDENSTWNNIGEDQLDGADIIIEDIHTDGTLGGRFTAENGWTTQNGKLPGLFGNVVDIPPHLSLVPVPPVITTTTLPDGEVDEEYYELLIATGTRPIIWTVSSGNLPVGLTLSSDGSISGVPTAEGEFEFTLTATNSEGSDQQDLSITINAAQVPPYIITETLPEAFLGTPYSFTLEAEGTKPITWSIVGGSSVAGITLSMSGVLSGTPTTEGTFDFSVTATNSVGSDTKPFSITISEVGNIVGAEYFPTTRIYPNPTTGELRIMNYELRIMNDDVIVEIFDMTGRSVGAYGIRPDGTINISHLSNGMYILKIENQTFKITKK